MNPDGENLFHARTVDTVKDAKKLDKGACR